MEFPPNELNKHCEPTSPITHFNTDWLIHSASEKVLLITLNTSECSIVRNDGRNPTGDWQIGQINGTQIRVWKSCRRTKIRPTKNHLNAREFKYLPRCHFHRGLLLVDRVSVNLPQKVSSGEKLNTSRWNWSTWLVWNLKQTEERLFRITRNQSDNLLERNPSQNIFPSIDRDLSNGNGVLRTQCSDSCSRLNEKTVESNILL